MTDPAAIFVAWLGVTATLFLLGYAFSLVVSYLLKIYDGEL